MFRSVSIGKSVSKAVVIGNTCKRCASNTRSVGIVGVPMHKGQRKTGVDDGPQAIREAGLVEKLAQNKGMTVRDYGNVEVYQTSEAERYFDDKTSAPIYNSEGVGSANSKIADTVESVIKANDLCVSIGGDHSMGIGTVSGHARVNPNLKVIWVDAHPDLNLPTTTLSGNMHGMPMGMLLKELAGKSTQLPGFDWFQPCLQACNLGFIAIRDIDHGELDALRRYNIPHVSMRDIDRDGIAKCVEYLLDSINPEAKFPMHMSYDIDSIDPLIAPSTGTPVMGGLTYREGLYIAEEVARTGCLRGLDLVEVNPTLGSAEDAITTARVAVDIISHASGACSRDVSPYKVRNQT